ncbi:MAG TPA: hypothetical protein VIK86_07075 [Candidatus Paceibacterota bacterium]
MKGKINYSVNYGENMGTNPAKINVVTGEMSLNPKIWDSLPYQEKEIIQIHENGHLIKKTVDELEADKYLVETYGTDELKLIAIAKTIGKYVPNNAKTKQRKLALLKNIVKQNDINTNGYPNANLIGEIIEGVLGITAAILPSLLGDTKPENNSIWQQTDGYAKQRLIGQAFFDAVFEVYCNSGASWSSVQQKIALSPIDTSSILYKTWASLANQGLFNNGSSEVDINPSTFWTKNTIQLKLSDIQSLVENRYNSLPFYKQVIYSPLGKVAIIGIVAFLAFKLILK